MRRTPEYRFGGHMADKGRMHVSITRIDGLPEFDARGERFDQRRGLEEDELFEELRILVHRLRAFDEPADDEPAPTRPRVLTIAGGRFKAPFDKPGDGEAGGGR